jgi:hypothetical protein
MFSMTGIKTKKGHSLKLYPFFNMYWWRYFVSNQIHKLLIIRKL